MANDHLNNGGPAFPHPGGSSDSTVQESHLGMSLRDWLAGQALVGFIASFSGPDIALPPAERAARAAYEYADAMLAKRAEAH